MNEEQHGTSINSLAEAIARRITSIRNLAAEKGEPYPTDEIAGQFSLMCERSVLHFGPSAPAALTARRITRQSAGSFHRTGEFESDRQDEHHAAGIGEIFRMMAEHMRCRADVHGPAHSDRDLLVGFPEKQGGKTES
jgi:hypothetical protein